MRQDKSWAWSSRIRPTKISAKGWMDGWTQWQTLAIVVVVLHAVGGTDMVNARKKQLTSTDAVFIIRESPPKLCQCFRIFSGRASFLITGSVTRVGRPDLYDLFSKIPRARLLTESLRRWKWWFLPSVTHTSLVGHQTLTTEIAQTKTFFIHKERDDGMWDGSCTVRLLLEAHKPHIWWGTYSSIL